VARLTALEQRLTVEAFCDLVRRTEPKTGNRTARRTTPTRVPLAASALNPFNKRRADPDLDRRFTCWPSTRHRPAVNGGRPTTSANFVFAAPVNELPVKRVESCLRVPARGLPNGGRLGPRAGGWVPLSGPALNGLGRPQRPAPGSWPGRGEGLGRGQGELSPARLADLTASATGAAPSRMIALATAVGWWRCQPTMLPWNLPQGSGLQRQGRLTLSPTWRAGERALSLLRPATPRPRDERWTPSSAPSWYYLPLTAIPTTPSLPFETPLPPTAGCLWTS